MVEVRSLPVKSLYVHVPFCAQKCVYCAFYSEASNGETVNRYVDALTREMELVAGDLRPETVFFGGGTPSLLNLRQWQQIFKAMQRLNLLGAAEWTIECNPATVSPDKARLFRDHGVNRISMGVQSLDEGLLERLGRVHSRDMVFKSFDVLRRAGFENLNLDLMFAIPGQTLAMWRETLAEATAMESEHLSSYEVIYEEDTALYAQLKAGKIHVDEDLACAMYDELTQCAARSGFRQYEVANFAKDSTPERPHAKTASLHESPFPGKSGGAAEPRCESNDEFLPASRSGLPVSAVPSYACLHNVNYWRGGAFYGLGPSATTYVRGVRTKNWSNTQRYCELLEQGKLAAEGQETLSPLARAGETAAFGLRMVAGWPFELFRMVTGYDLRQEWAADMRYVVHQGWGLLGPDRFQLTPQGLRFADSAAERFLR